MSTSYTLATLKAAVKVWANNTHTVFDSYISDVAIPQAESRMLRDLDLELFESSESITITNNSNSVTKPSGTVTCEYLMILRSGQTRWDIIQRRTRDLCRWVATTQTGVPKYFSDLTTTTWFVAPTPQNTYSSPNAIAIVVKRPNGLVTDTSGTWLSQNMGDMLFWATAMECQSYQKNPSKVQEALQLYASLVPAAKAESDSLERRRYADVGTTAAEQMAGAAAADMETSQ